MYFFAKSTQKVGNLPKTCYLTLHNHGKQPIKAYILAFGKPIITYILVKNLFTKPVFGSLGTGRPGNLTLQFLFSQR